MSRPPNAHWAIFYVPKHRKAVTEVEWHPSGQSAMHVFANYPKDPEKYTIFVAQVYGVIGKHSEESVAIVNHKVEEVTDVEKVKV